MSNYDILVNKTHLLSPRYVPDNLIVPCIPFDAPINHPKRLLEREAAQAATCLFQVSKKQKLCLYGISGYRSYARQKELFAPHKNSAYVAPPGGSEHQTGLALDVSTPSIFLELEEQFDTTPEGIWLARNAHLFGFILRYPKSKENITGYAYEPWHIRYVTKPLALYLTITDLTLEEYHRHAAIAPSGVP